MLLDSKLPTPRLVGATAEAVREVAGFLDRRAAVYIVRPRASSRRRPHADEANAQRVAVVADADAQADVTAPVVSSASDGNRSIDGPDA